MKPLPWSFSALTHFTTCPFQFAEVRVYKRIQDQPGDMAIWGNWAHQQIEEHYKTLAPWHENMLPYVPHIERALEWAGGHGFHHPKEGQEFGKMSFSEYQMSLNSKLQPCTWTAEQVWLRGIADVLIVEDHEAWVIDWKFGKVKPTMRQLKLFALLVFYHFPRVTRVNTSFEWLQYGTETRDTFDLVDAPLLWQEFLPDLKQYKEAFATETWQKRQSGLCGGWCSVEHCPNWRPKK